MSLAKQLAAESNRVKNGKAKARRTTGVVVDVDIARVDNLLQALPIQLRSKVLRQAVRAAARVVAVQARSNLKGHRSKITGTSTLR